jgi:hypothetical protein
VPGIKSEPAPVQKHLEPGTEIHGRGVCRYLRDSPCSSVPECSCSGTA